MACLAAMFTSKETISKSQSHPKIEFNTFLTYVPVTNFQVPPPLPGLV